MTRIAPPTPMIPVTVGTSANPRGSTSPKATIVTRIAPPTFTIPVTVDTFQLPRGSKRSNATITKTATPTITIPACQVPTKFVGVKATTVTRIATPTAAPVTVHIWQLDCDFVSSCSYFKCFFPKAPRRVPRQNAVDLHTPQHLRHCTYRDHIHHATVYTALTPLTYTAPQHLPRSPCTHHNTYTAHIHHATVY